MKLEVRGLRAAPGGQEILHGIDLEARSGQMVGLIGPNGSGKSTLLRCICRALQPTGGAVLLDGAGLEQMSLRQSAQKMAVVAQHNAYAFDFTVEELVLLGRTPHKRPLERDTSADRRIAAQALAQVGLAGFGPRSYATLSGGEQQRVILARALAQQTPCLLLDEPTNHLDIKYQLDMLDLTEEDEVMVVGVAPWIYLYVDAGCGNYSTWQVHENSTQLYDYYALHPDKFPDVIYMAHWADRFLAADLSRQFTDKGYTVVYQGTGTVMMSPERAASWEG